MPYQDHEIPQLKNILMELIPEAGETKGNVTLRDAFIENAKSAGIQLLPEDYWTIRGLLIEDRSITVGRGRGGSVRRITPALSETLQNPADLPGAPAINPKERDLYAPFLETINHFFVSDYRIKLFVSEITAQQGSRSTGGQWTRPDITLVAVKMHEFIPGKSIEVFTFEIKPFWAINIDGVFEASSHSAFANRSFLAIHVAQDVPDALIDRLESECKRFGTGLILFNDVTDWGTYEIRVDAQRHTPDADDTDQFIATQISFENRDKLRAWVR